MIGSSIDTCEHGWVTGLGPCPRCGLEAATRTCTETDTKPSPATCPSCGKIEILGGCPLVGYGLCTCGDTAGYHVATDDRHGCSVLGCDCPAFAPAPTAGVSAEERQRFRGLCSTESFLHENGQRAIARLLDALEAAEMSDAEAHDHLEASTKARARLRAERDTALASLARLLQVAERAYVVRSEGATQATAKALGLLDVFAIAGSNGMVNAIYWDLREALDAARKAVR